MYRILVTGGAGFIGSNLCEGLLAKGCRVRVLDNLSTGKIENLEGVIGSIEFFRGDVRDIRAVEMAVKGVDYIIHLAALGSVARSIEDPFTTNDVNVNGTLNVLLAAKDTFVRRVVFASSSSVYGDTPVLPKKEDMPPCPRSPYAVSKLAGEAYCQVFNGVYGLETVALRYFNVYGRRQRPDSMYAAVIPRFMAALLNGGRPVIYGDGEQRRDFTFVDDCNQANMKACFAPGVQGRRFNVARGSMISVNELFRKLARLSGSGIEPEYAFARKGDVRDSLADISAAREALSYEPAFDMDAGLARTFDWYSDIIGKVA